MPPSSTRDPSRERTFGSDDDRKPATRTVPLDDLLANPANVIRYLRDQNDISGTGETGVQRDEAGVSSHHLEYHDPIVTLRCGVQLVDRIECRVDRCIEAERRHSTADVIVYRLRHADNFQPALGESPRDLERSIPADGDDRVDAKTLHALEQVG